MYFVLIYYLSLIYQTNKKHFKTKQNEHTFNTFNGCSIVNLYSICSKCYKINSLTNHKQITHDTRNNLRIHHLINRLNFSLYISKNYLGGNHKQINKPFKHLHNDKHANNTANNRASNQRY